MAGRTANRGQVAVQLLLLLLTVLVNLDSGYGQTANCYSNSIFGCSGDTTQRANGQTCCDEGFLAFQTLGEETCSPCPDNSICQASSDCSDTFPGLGTQSSAQCCATGGGVAYTNSAGNCVGCPSAIEGCFDDTGCSGDSVTLSSTGSGNQVRECCLGSGLSYSLIDQCIDCTVYGFLQDEVNESERGQGYPIQIGYIKGSGGVLRGRVNVVPGGTAVEGSDFSLSSTIFTARAGNPAEIIVTFRVDSVAQEVDETAQLQLSLTTTPPSGAIFQDTVDFLIRDSDDVIFQLTENDYRSNENDLRMNIVVNKNVRLANPVTFLLTPYNVTQATDSGLPLPANVPPDNNPFSPNRAKSYPEDRRDFSSDVITVMFPADEGTGPAINDVDAPVAIFNDVINEAQEEVFVVVLSLESATNPDSITISRPSSLCRIIDDDEIRIGFQNASYTFLEPEFETEIFETVFLEKESGRISEQTFLVVIESSVATPNANIRPAAISTEDDDGNIINNDYVISRAGVTVVIPPFGPEAQTLDFSFTLFPDSIAEGLEAFQASSSPSEDTSIPDFSAPTPNVLYASTFIVIVDNDPITIGLEQNFTVAEDAGSFQACFRVFNPPDNEDFALNLDLVIDTVAGTAGELDYTPIRSSNLDVFETLSQNQRRACFDVVITADNVFENDETFSLRLDFDEFVPQATRDSVTIEPSVVYVSIQDVTPLTIGFIDPPYSSIESDASITFQVGVIGETILERDVIVNFSTIDGVSSELRAAFAGSDFTAESNFPLTFNSGVSSITIEVPLIDDDVFELTESFSGQLSLLAPVDRLIIDPDVAEANITDDDVLQVGFNQTCYSFSEESGTNQVFLGLSGNPGEFTITVNYQSADGSALEGLDYARVNNTLAFTSQGYLSSNVEILSDNVTEGLENFQLSIHWIVIWGGNRISALNPQESGRIVLDPDTALVKIEGSPPTTLPPTTLPPDVPFVNDTVIGDPLFTVPLTNANFNGIDLNIEGQPSLCFEIHGDANQYFNLLTDNCVSVNARYTALTDFLNVINRIGVRAVDDMGQCHDISVDLEGCSASVDGIALTSNYRSAGIFIRPYRNHVRVSVPNCNGFTHLVMYILCQQDVTLRDPLDGELFTASMIKYVITHGVSLNENSHGLLGQFWNVPIEVSEYIDSDLEGDHYELSVAHPDFSGTRRFVGHLLSHSWEEKTPCFYVGNVQGGPIYEVEDPNDSVIEGNYKDYRMDGAFDTSYVYSRFDDSQCA